VGLIAVVALLAGLSIATDWGEIRKALLEADWKPIPSALLFTAISYACISFSFAKVSRTLGIRMAQRNLAEIGFVTTVLNHVMSSGGVFGYSLRFLLMKRHGVGMQEVLSASILHYYLTSMMMLAMLPISFYYLLTNSTVSPGVTAILGVMIILLVLVFAVASGMLFIRSIRCAVLDLAARAIRSLTHRDIEPALDQFETSVAHGLTALWSQPFTLLLIIMLIAVDWVFSAVALLFCFDALGQAIEPGVLMSGFVIGIIAGVLSMVPGGIGIQEGSMAGIFTLLGASLEKSILASILFRVIYFLIPFVVSLGFYWQILRRRVGSEPH
jgi:uncharacterized protein (TIRG00374 family)